MATWVGDRRPDLCDGDICGECTPYGCVFTSQLPPFCITETAEWGERENAIMRMVTICPDCKCILSVGDFPFCPHGRPGPFYSGDSSIHTSERAVLIRNPETGETRVPGRADRPIHPKYVAAGFTERVELTHSDIKRMERTDGLIHERSNFDPGSSTAEKQTGSI